MKCRNILCPHNRKDRSCNSSVVVTSLCVRRKLFERIIKEGHGHANLETANEARGARLMLAMVQRGEDA